MSKLNEKQKVMAIAGAAIGLCLLSGGGVYWAGGLVEETKVAIVAKERDIAAAEAKIKKIPDVENEVIVLRENLGEYVKILPDNSNLDDFVRELNNYTDRAKILVRKFQPLRTKAPGKKAESFLRTTYMYEMDASLWQFMQFISFIENWTRFVSITDIKIDSGDAKKIKDVQLHEDSVVHKIALTMETFTYNGKSVEQEVNIPNYENRRLELNEEIQKRMQNLKVEKYDYKGMRMRRDIFVDPRPRANTMEAGVPIQEQLKHMETLLGDLKAIEEIQRRLGDANSTIFEHYQLEKAMRDGLVALQTRIDETNERGLITAQNLKLRMNRELLGPMDRMRTALEKGDDKPTDPYLPLEGMEQLVNDMVADLNNGNLEDARNRYDLVMTKLLVPDTDPRHELAVRAKQLHIKASTAIEFRSLNLKIQGVLVNHGGRSGLLMNGQSYEEGEYVTDDLLVKQVQEEQVFFVFKGLTLVRTL